MHTYSETLFLITFKTACGCVQSQWQPEYVVRDMEFLHLPITKTVHGGGTTWRFRTFKCTNVNTEQRTALYEEYMP